MIIKDILFLKEFLKQLLLSQKRKVHIFQSKISYVTKFHTNLKTNIILTCFEVATNNIIDDIRYFGIICYIMYMVYL